MSRHRHEGGRTRLFRELAARRQVACDACSAADATKKAKPADPDRALASMGANGAARTDICEHIPSSLMVTE
jgi:hypothetical protein